MPVLPDANVRMEGKITMRASRLPLVLLAIVAAVGFNGFALSSQTTSQSPTYTVTDTPDDGVPMTVEGLVRDVACPMQNHKSTATDFSLECARACAKAGSPLVILTKSDEMYFPMTDQMPDTNQRMRLVPYVGKYVRVTGTVRRRNGTRTIVIKSITEMKDVKLNTNLGSD
jgi:DNA/RNA endonuclease YhcR with UshA esterase domain